MALVLFFYYETETTIASSETLKYQLIAFESMTERLFDMETCFKYLFVCFLMSE